MGPLWQFASGPQSSDPLEPEELDNVALYPSTQAWLAELDAGMRSDGHNFSQCVESFEREKYNRVSDLADLDVQDILELCPGIPHGTATKILTYAKKDTDKIHKSKAKLIRETKKQCYHY